MSVIERDANELRGILRASGHFDPGSRAFLLVNALESAGRSFEVQATDTQGAASRFERVGKLAAWIERDRRESDKVIAYAQELARLAIGYGGP